MKFICTILLYFICLNLSAQELVKKQTVWRDKAGRITKVSDNYSIAEKGNWLYVYQYDTTLHLAQVDRYSSLDSLSNKSQSDFTIKYTFRGDKLATEAFYIKDTLTTETIYLKEVDGKIIINKNFYKKGKKNRGVTYRFVKEIGGAQKYLLTTKDWYDKKGKLTRSIKFIVEDVEAKHGDFSYFYKSLIGSVALNGKGDTLQIARYNKADSVIYKKVIKPTADGYDIGNEESYFLAKDFPATPISELTREGYFSNGDCWYDENQIHFPTWISNGTANYDITVITLRKSHFKLAPDRTEIQE